MPERLRKIEELPKDSDMHHWADYAELRCLADPDGLVSVAQFVDMIREGRDKGEGKADAFGGDEVTAGEVDAALMPEGEAADDLDDPSVPSDPWEDLDRVEDADDEDVSDAEKQDAVQDLAADVFVRLRWRESAFGDAWPFEVRRGRLLALRDPSPARRNYAFFLLCASLRWFSKGDQARLTTAFERVSHQAMVRAYPGWEVHLFGTSAEAGGRYVGELYPRLQKLAKDLRCRLKVGASEFKSPDNGDNGLDVVAWLPFASAGSKGLPLAFAQCASGATNWKEKQEEVSAQRWGATLDLEMPVTNWTFIPFCYHGSGGDWENRRHVHKGVLADRLRLCDLLLEDLDTDLAGLPDDLLADVGLPAG